MLDATGRQRPSTDAKTALRSEFSGSFGRWRTSKDASLVEGKKPGSKILQPQGVVSKWIVLPPRSSRPLRRSTQTRSSGEAISLAIDDQFLFPRGQLLNGAARSNQAASPFRAISINGPMIPALFKDERAIVFQRLSVFQRRLRAESNPSGASG